MSNPTNTALLKVDLNPGRPAMMLVETPEDLRAWAADHSEALRSLILDHGSIHIRGLRLANVDQVGQVINELASELMVETEAFASRDPLPGGLYSSSAWPANQQMCMHHELSYTLNFPGTLFMACLVAPTGGGATAVADAAAVLNDIPTDLVERFEREGWMLTRSYTDEIGLPYAEAFGTEDRATIERYCQANAIEFEWQDDGGLRTRQLRSAVMLHPVTGQRCWFNQVAFLSEWTLNPEVREFLVDMYGADGLPFNTRFGNGDPIGEDVVELINEAYAANTIQEPWQDGDLMIVDNIRTAHSREPFEGPREIIVALGDPMHLAIH